MAISNKLGILFFGVNLLLPTFAHSLIIEPVKIDSSQGEPLYAEIPFHNASSQSPLQVSIAQPFELGLPEVLDAAKTAHYNFYVRQNNQGNGVIVITSSRPIHDNALNLVLKINDNGQVHMQQLRNRLPSRIDRLKSTLHETPLQPRIVVNEADLELNLPESSTSNEQSLALNTTPPPMLKNTTNNATAPVSNVGLAAMNTANSQTAATTAVTSAAPAPVVTIQAEKTIPVTATQSENLSIQVSRRSPDQPPTVFAETQFSTPSVQQNIQPKPQPTVIAKADAPVAPNKQTTTSVSQTTNPEQQFQVKANDSLWAIASQIAKNQNTSVTTVMQDIQKNNAHAFVNGNANRLKQGVVLNIPSNYNLPVRANAPETAKQQVQPPKATTKNTPQNDAQKQNEAHMSIVANTNQGAIQGASKAGSSESSAQQNELTIKLKQARSSTVNLQNNVRQLDQQLREKEKRIALLNARLAELEQQLKSRQTQQNTSSNISNTTSKSQGVIPAFIAGTLVAFAGLNSNFAIATLLQELI